MVTLERGPLRPFCQPKPIRSLSETIFFYSRFCALSIVPPSCLPRAQAGWSANPNKAEARLMRTSTAKAVAKQIEEWLRQFAKAYSRKDLDAVMEMMDSDRPLLVLGSGPDEKRFSPRQLKKGFQRDFSQADDITMGFKWIKIDTQGDVAWFASELKVAVTACKRKAVYPYRFTGVLVKGKRSWRLCMGQMGLIAADQSSGDSWPSTK
jgi:ketosteroid isomerase-like protein